MIGRSDEIRLLRRLVGATYDGASTPAVAFVAGEPGVGKSRLVFELLQSLPRDWRVLTGQADPGTLGRPFELLLDAIGEFARPESGLGGEGAGGEGGDGRRSRLV